MPNRILITGGTGLLGSELACCFSKDFDIYRVGSADFDIRDIGQVKSFMEDAHPDVVLHAAAIADVDFCERDHETARAVNVEGTENIARVCRDIGAFMVYYSTDYVFEGSKGSPYVETDDTGPVNYYGITKLEGERAVISIMDKYVILRVAWLYANHDKAFINRLIKKGQEQIDKKVLGENVFPEKIISDQVGSPTYAFDVARQTELILEKGLTGLYHCVAGGETSRYSLAEFIFRHLSMPVDLLPCKSEEFFRIAPRPKYSALENKKLDDLGLNIMPDYKTAVIEYLKEFVLA